MARPDAPINVVATDANPTITITWDAVPNTYSYAIYRATSFGALGGVIGITDNLTWVDFPGYNITFWYGVVARTSSGCSELSAQDGGTAVPDPTPVISPPPPIPPPTTVPDPPANVVAEFIPMNGVQITWTASIGATQYTVYRSLISGQRGQSVANVTSATAIDATVAPSTTYWYGITARNAQGESPLSLQGSVTTPTPPGQTITSFTASSTSIVAGSSVTLTWATANATVVKLNNAIVANSGTATFTPSVSTTYVLTVSGSQPDISQTIGVTVTPVQAVTSFTLTPSTITVGQSVAIAWATTNATAVTLNGTPVANSGSTTDSPTINKTYTLVVTGAGPTLTRVLSVVVNQIPQTITSFTVTPSAITAGGTVTIAWVTANSTAVTLNGALVAASGSTPDSPTVDKTYTLVVTGPAPTLTRVLSVAVTPAPTPQTITSFTVTPDHIISGNSVTVAWATANSTGVTLNSAPVAASGSVPDSPTVDKSYTLVVSGSAPDISQVRSVVVAPVPPPPAQTITTFTALPSSITSGQSITVTWATTNATTVKLNNVTVAASGSQGFSPTVNTTYTLLVSGSLPDISSTASVTVVTPPPPQTITTFTALPASITTGQSVTVTWATTNATTVRLNGVVVAASGSQVFTPSASTTYTLLVSGSVPNISRSASVTVSAPVQPQTITTFTALPTNIVAGQSSTISWATANASQVKLNNVVVAASGSTQVSPAVTTTYTLLVSGSLPDISQTVGVTVVPAPQTITSFTISPLVITAGGTVLISWATTGSTAVRLNGTLVAASGSTTATPAVNTSYTLLVSGSAPDISRVINVTVTPTPPAPTITNFAASPPVLPPAGGSVVLTATVTNATSMTLDGVALPSLPVTKTLTATHTYQLVAHGVSAPDATANATVTVQPVVPTGLVPVLGPDRMHVHQGWSADYADGALLAPRGVPWTVPFADIPAKILAMPKNGAVPSRIVAYHHCGNNTELYSEVPFFDKFGRSNPYSSQVSDDLYYIVEDLNDRPPPVGVRGVCIPVSYVTMIAHPAVFPAGAPNAGQPIPRAPLWIMLRHDGMVQQWERNGDVTNHGIVPTVTHSWDATIDLTNRKIFWIVTADSTSPSVWANGRVIRADRTPGIASEFSPENATKYLVTTYQTMPAGVVPTAVRTDDAGNVFVAGGGVIYRNTVAWLTVPNVFAMDYGNGKLYVVRSTGETNIIDIATKAITPNLMQSIGISAPVTFGVDFFTISVDKNGAFGPVGNFAVGRVHLNGNTNTWQFSPDGSIVKYGFGIYGSSQSWQTVGTATYVHELFGHYDWIGGKYHDFEAVRCVGGYANAPISLIVADPPIPLDNYVDYTLIWHGMRAICRGGPTDAQTRPSLGCWITREGWSPFAGCSADEIAEMASFDAMEAFIVGGMIGQFPRNDYTPLDRIGMMEAICRGSQRNLKEGATFTNALRAWYVAKYGAPPVPAAVVQPAFNPESPQYLEARATSGTTYRIGVFNLRGAGDQRYLQGPGTNEAVGAPIPADAVIWADWGLPSQTTSLAGLPAGPHAFTVRSTVMPTRATVIIVP